MAGDGAERLDLKITNAALAEMRLAFQLFAPYRTTPKITMFGSARTLPEDPLYIQARDLAAELARKGWMVITGAGPGIMAAGLEGAGREQSFGVNIRLPFEQGANPFIEGDKKLIEMRYFFTRKLMLMKESDGFVVLPGGFGTLDEGFELLTLLQTGKAEPAPIVYLDVPGGTYWASWDRFVRRGGRGARPDQRRGPRALQDHRRRQGGGRRDPGFYRNFHSIRYVGATLVIRLRAMPTAPEVAAAGRRVRRRRVSAALIELVEAFPVERSNDDHVDLPRLALAFDRMHHGRLRQMIDAINALPSAPPQPSAPPRPVD